MNQINLIRKFKPQKTFDFFNHIIKTLRIISIYGFLLIPINCLLNITFHFRIRQIMTYQFWSSDDIINSNIAIPISLSINLFYIIVYQQQKARMIKDYILTNLICHITLVLIINHEIRFNLFLYLAIIGIIVIIIGQFIALKIQQNRMIEVIAKLQKTPFNNKCKQQYNPNIIKTPQIIQQNMKLIQTKNFSQTQNFDFGKIEMLT